MVEGNLESLHALDKLSGFVGVGFPDCSSSHKVLDRSHNIFSVLGWRGIRFLLSRPDYLIPHLRAILRSTVHGPVRILIPMVATLDELLEVKSVLNSTVKQLEKENVPFSKDYYLGVMLEVPSALWTLKGMMEHIDFVSIGTNDLTQYTFAVDRGNPKVTKWFQQYHPVLLRMIKQTCDIVKSFPGKKVSLCGEIAGIPLGVPILVGAGVDYLSMSPWRIPKVRKVLKKVTLEQCQEICNEALNCDLDDEILSLMESYSKKYNFFVD